MIIAMAKWRKVTREHDISVKQCSYSNIIKYLCNNSFVRHRWVGVIRGEGNVLYECCSEFFSGPIREGIARSAREHGSGKISERIIAPARCASGRSVAAQKPRTTTMQTTGRITDDPIVQTSTCKACVIVPATPRATRRSPSSCHTTPSIPAWWFSW